MSVVAWLATCLEADTGKGRLPVHQAGPRLRLAP